MSTTVPSGQSEHDAILADLGRRGLAYKAKNGKPAIRYAGALTLAHERGLVASKTTLVQIPSKDNGMTAVVHAEVLFNREGRDYTFSDLGTCSPANANAQTANYPIEMASTRALVRALRQGINAGDLQFAEISGDDPDAESPQEPARAATPQAVRPFVSPSATARPAPPAKPSIEPASEQLYARLHNAASVILADYGQTEEVADDMTEAQATARLNELMALYRRLKAERGAPDKMPV